MVHHFLASPFADAAHTARFAAVRAALQAAGGPATLLLGNLVLEDGAAPLDVVVVRPHSITLLVLAAGSGRLSMSALGPGRWLLNGTPHSVFEAFDNPFEQFTQQKAALAAWLQPRFNQAQADLRAISGAVLFEGPVAPEPDAQAALAAGPADFRLLNSATELPRWLAELASPAINLREEDIAEWAAEWAEFVAAPPNASSAAPAISPTVNKPAVSDFIQQKARALWNWLGAHDVPDDDPPYGYAAALSARNEEKQHLEQLRRQMQADLSSQLQALAAREAEREHSIAQLRAELAQAPPVAAAATALVSRLGTETREKAALEAEMAASKQESEARNRELDAKIQQLSQLIEQLSARPVAEAAAATAPPAQLSVRPAPAAAKPEATGTRVGASFVTGWVQAAHTSWAPHFRQAQRWARRQPRVALLGGGVAVLGLGIWGLSHLGDGTLTPYQENGRWGYADASGQPVVPARFTVAEPFREGRAVVAKDGAYGFVDEKGREVLAPAYDALNPYAGGYARARVGDAYTFVDEDGQEFDHYYFNARDFAEGRAAVLDHRGWHYISGPEEPENPVIFAEAYSFVDGLARVKLSDGYTYITPDYLEDPSQGTKPFGRYKQAADFANGKARVTQAGRRFVIDKDGEEVK
jgi:hypothetical protein